MRRLALPLLGLMLLAVGGSCAAQTVIHRCTAADGTPVFTDQACASLDALPARSTVNPLVPRGAGLPRHCPLDVGSLRERVASAFRNHDANALAGLMLWGGYAPREATDIVRRLAELMRSPFLGFDDTAQPPAAATSVWWPPLVPSPAATTAPLAPVASATMTLKLGNAVQPELKLDVTRRDGCVWLQPPDATSPASR